MAAPVDGTHAGDLPDVLRAWVDLVETAGECRPSPVTPDPEPISPELVLVDPALRSRLAELPTGPSLPPVLRIVEVPAPPAPAQRSSGLGLVASVAYVLALVLALPVLAIASDLVRSGGPRLAPPATNSGQVHVSLQKHVVPKHPRSQPVHYDLPR